MHIAHIIDTLDPKQGGPPIVAFRLAAGQSALGHDVSLISSSSAASANRVRASIRNVSNAQDLALPIVSPARASIHAISRLHSPAAATEMRRLFDAVDVAHFHSVWCGITTLGTTLCRAMGVPYVIQPHGQLDPWSLRQRAAKKRIVLALGARRMLNDAGGLLLLNEDERTGIAPLRLRSGEQRVIHNGIDLAELLPAPPKGAFRARHAVLRDRPYVLFLSRLHFKKGLDHLAEAFAIVARARPDAMLVVIGPDDGEQGPFQALVEKLGIAKHVLIPGPQFGRSKVEALVDGDAFCLPSRQEGFSISILEALACGCPVVVSDACHFPEVASGGAGYVVPLDPKQIADALLSLLNDPGRARAMGDAGRSMVAERYTWDVACRQTIDLYEAILKDSRVLAGPGS